MVRALATSSPQVANALKESSGTITPAAQDALRLKEGFPLRYHEIDVIVHTTSTQAPVRAVTYVVTPTHRLDVDLPVTDRYRALILAGAKHFGFSESYQKELHRVLRTAPSLLTIARQGASLQLR